jgi:fibronectin-binding autotransporter adhesin
VKSILPVKSSLLFVVFVAASLATQSARAQSNYTWQGPGGTTSSPTSGTWDTATANWNTGSSTDWVNGNNAIFGGTSTGTTTITLGTTAISAYVLEFTSATDAYTLSAAAPETLTLTEPGGENSSGQGGEIELGPGVTATLGSNITVATAGPIDINGTSGTNGVNAGILELSGATLSCPFNNFVVDGGATVYVNTGSTISVGSYLKLGRDGGGTDTMVINGGSVITTSTGNGVYVGDSGYANGSTGTPTGVLTISSGTLTIGSTLSINNGTVNLNGGTILVGAGGYTSAGSSALGDIGTGGSTGTLSSSDLNIFNFNGGTLQATGSSTAFMAGLSVNGSFTFASGSGAFVKAGGAIINNGGYNITISQPLLTGVSSGTDGGLTSNGTGTLTLSGVNTYNGATTVNAGTLQIGNGTSGSISSSSALVMGGGNFLLYGVSGASSTTSQTVASLSTAANTSSTITLNPDGETGAGAIKLTITSNTLSIGANSVLNFNYTAGTTNGATLGNDYVVWSPTLTNGIIGANYTVTDMGGSDYATVTSGKVVRFTDPGNDGLPVSVGAGGTNYWVDSGYSTTSTSTAGSLVEALSGNVSANTISVNTTGLTSGANLALGGNTLTLTSGGGMFISGANPYSITSTSGGGITTSSSGGALTFNNYDTGTVTLSAPILANGANAVTFAGPGTTVLTGANTYTGPTTVAAGTVEIGNGTTGTIGSSSGATVASGATLDFDLTGGSAYNAPITDNGTVSDIAPNGNLSLGGTISGTGAVAFYGTGTLTLSTANTYTGGTILENANSLGVATVLVNGASGTPFGSVAGTISLYGGNGGANENLIFAPSGQSGAVAYQIGTISQYASSGEDTLTLNAGTATSVTVNTAGFYGGTALTHGNPSNLVIVAADGLANLGVSGGKDFLTATSTAGFTQTNNIVDMFMVGQDNNVNQSADFLTYDYNGSTLGFESAAVAGIETSTFGATNVVAITTNTSISGANSAYGLKIGNSATSQAGLTTLTNTGTITIGATNPNGTRQTLILNNAAIAGSGTLQFSNGSSIYTDLGGGNIANNITVSGNAIIYGPGVLTISGTAQYTNNQLSLEGALNVTGDLLESTSGGLVYITNTGSLTVAAGGELTGGGSGSTQILGGGATFIGTDASIDAIYLSDGSYLNVESNTGLGAGGSPGSAVPTSVTVNSSTNPNTGAIIGSVLRLSGNITTDSAVPLYLNGSGYNTTQAGALENVSGNNTYTGAVTLTSNSSIGADAGSTLNLTNGGVLTTNGYALTLTGAGAGNIQTTISGSGSLIKIGTGTWTLEANANTYTGTTTINAGVLALYNQLSAENSIISINTGTGTTGTNNALQFVTQGSPSPWTIGGLSGTSNEALLDTIGYGVALTVGNNNDTGMVYSGVLSGSGGSLIMTGTGTQTLSGANTYNGGTSITSGVLEFAKINSMPASGAVAVSSGGTVAVAVGGTGQFTNATSGAGSVGGLFSGVGGQGAAVTLSSGSEVGIDTTSAPGGSFTYAGNITNIGVGLMKLGTGTLVLTATNSYTGATTITGGTLELANALAAENSIVAISTGTGTTGTNNALEFLSQGSSSAYTIGGLSGGSNEALLDSAGNTVALTVGNNNDTGMTYSGVLSGAGSLTKIGTGTQTLSGFNTFTGGTTVNGGTLILAAGGANGTLSGVLTINSGATVLLSVSNALGYNGGTGTVATINVNGGTLTNTYSSGIAGQSYLTNYYLTGGNVSATQAGDFNFNTGYGITSNASSTTSVWSAPINIRGTSVAISTASGTTPTGIDLSVSGGIVGTIATSGLVKNGTGVLQLSGADTYTGTTTITAGTLDFGKEVSLYNDTTANWTAANIIVQSGGTLALGVGANSSGYFTTSDVNTLLTNLDGAVTTGGLQAGSAIGFDTTNASGGTFTVSNVIANTTGSGGGSVGLEKLGVGTLILSGANTYTGPTAINAGTLELDGSLASGSAVADGGASASGTPILSGTGTASGAVTVAAATISPGSVANPLGTLKVGSISFQNGSTLAVDLSSTTSNELVSNGAATFAGTDNVTFTGSTGATTTTGVGNYVLATATSGLTTGAFTGAAPVDYRLLGTGTQLNLTHEATIGTIAATPAASSIITGGSTTFTITVANSAPTNSSSLSAGATAGTSTTGSIAANTITTAPGATSASYSGLSFAGTTVGAGQTGTFTVSDPNSDNSPQTGNVSVNVYGHASGSLSGSTLNIGDVHAGYAGTVTSSNSVTASNAAGYLVALNGSDTTGGNISMNSVSNVAAGGTSGAITATLAAGQGVGSFSSQTYTYADDSSLNGASSNVGTSTVAISGEVYSGTSTWSTDGSGSWGTLTGTGSEAFGANWGANQGSPGLDPNFTGVDTATFGSQAVASATVSLNAAAPNLNSITFSSPVTGYTLAQGTGSSSITLSGTTPSINVTGNATAGSQTISAPVILGSNTGINVGSNQTLNLNGQVSGSGYGVAYSGPGTTITTANNIYTGGTTVSGGTLYVNNTGGASYSAPITNPHAAITATNSTGSGTGTGGVTVMSGGTLAGFGTIAPTSGGVTINSGGTLASGGIQSGTTAGTGLTINNSLNLSSALLVSGGASMSFDLGSTTAYNGGSGALNFANPNTNSTYLTLTGSTVDQIFASTTTADTINLTDLTYGSSTLALTLRSQNPYLLIQTGLGNDADFSNLVTSGGTGMNGYVLGISNGAGGYTAFNINAYSVNGVQLNSASNLQGLGLYLYNGDLEVVPEPGTLALMLGGLMLLIVIQRRRKER